MTDLINCQQPMTALCSPLERSLSNNNLDAEAAKHLSNALVSNQSLVKLWYAPLPLMTSFIIVSSR